MKRALLYEHYKDGGTQKVKCLLCPHNCIIAEGHVGICSVRKNVKGELYSLNYHRVAATHSDPIEKKPLYHFLPGSSSFSIAAMGCNFKCLFCQNHSLAQVESEEEIYGNNYTPEQLVNTALKTGSQSISYTYSEPTIYFELMLETAALAKEKGLKNVMVTNGFMSPAALKKIAPVMDAANVDLKSFRDDFYKKYCSARLSPVLDTIAQMKQLGIWIEVTTLLIPELNWNFDEIKELIAFIAGVDKSIPWHVSRFYPQYKLTDLPPTDPIRMFTVLDTARKMGLEYLYAGNVNSREWEDTRCPNCKTVLIHRSGYSTQVTNLEKGRCNSCNHPISGIWE